MTMQMDDDTPHPRVLWLAVVVGILMAAMTLAPLLPGKLPTTVVPLLQVLVLVILALDVGAGRDVDSFEFKTLPALLIFVAHVVAAWWPWADALVVLAFLLMIFRCEDWEWQRQQASLIVMLMIGALMAYPFPAEWGWAFAAFLVGMLGFLLTSRWGLIGRPLVEERISAKVGASS